jgi:hypothetical protein
MSRLRSGNCQRRRTLAEGTPALEYPVTSSIIAATDVSVPVVPAATGRLDTRPTDVRPLAPERYKIQFTVGRDTYKKLCRAQDLLRHRFPDGDPAAIFDRAITLLVSQVEQKKIAATDRPRSSRILKVVSRHIPAAVKRTVWQRDGGRCAFEGSNGRCTETGFLEFHHVVPYAAGGEISASNIELRCRVHNQHEAREYFGPAYAPLVRERHARYEASNSFRNELNRPQNTQAVIASIEVKPDVEDPTRWSRLVRQAGHRHHRRIRCAPYPVSGGVARLVESVR